MQQECYSKNAPCVNRYGKPIAGSASGVARLASVVDDKDGALYPNLIRRMNGFVRSVQNQEYKEDLNSAWGPGAPLPDLLIIVATR